MLKRRKTRQIRVGSVGVGSDYPISIQSMTNTDTRDALATINQIKDLEEAGCEIIRVAIPDIEAVSVLGQIVKNVKIPVIADIHFDYKLAIKSVEAGISALRLNPGNIGSDLNVKNIVKCISDRKIPIRIGVNAGSLESEFQDMSIPDAMVASALRHVNLLEKFSFYDIKISLKSSSVQDTIEAYKKIANKVEYPLHIGLTEAGTYKSGFLKSAVVLGSLLSSGIGDTIRVSLTEDPLEEVKLAINILKASEIRKVGLNLISCPTCGRCKIDLINLAKQVEKYLVNVDKPITVAVMGCVVNGPGEAKHADIGIAGGDGKAVLFKKGKVFQTVPQDDVLNVLLREIDNFVV